MIDRIPLSGLNQDIADIWQWYQLTNTSFDEYLNSIIQGNCVAPEYVGMPITEVTSIFESAKNELENLVCFNLLSSVEAKLREDYIKRVEQKQKDHLSRMFRAAHQKYKGKISLEEIILDGWKKYYPQAKTIISDYKSALNYRHWLAHGRYWVPKLGQRYDVITVYTICDNLISGLQLS